jgi:hypothetical protein
MICLAISENEGKGEEVRTRLRKVFKTMQKGRPKKYESPLIYSGEWASHHYSDTLVKFEYSYLNDTLLSMLWPVPHRYLYLNCISNTI